jgi:NAD(P)-dependent dehydrogenase (short-subunit alcohol dehydrogenase family)
MPAELPGARVLLITGCSSGIGLDAARTMAARGWRVFAACRKAEDCARLQAEGLESPRIDYADPASIAAGLAEVLAATGGRLDALFNNGAFATPGAVEDLPTDALREIFEANLFGWHDLTRRVIPVMRAQGHGRIVQCSSVLGFIADALARGLCGDEIRARGADACPADGDARHPAEDHPDRTRPDHHRFRLNARAPVRALDRLAGQPPRRQYRDTLLPRLYATPARPVRTAPAAVTAKLIHALESPRPRRAISSPCRPGRWPR